MIKGDHLNICE